MIFVDRHDELATLEREYARDSASLVIVYGRRRVGKTSLLSEFCRSKRSLYFLATEESISENRNAFRNAVADFTNNSLLASGNSFGWDILFDQLTAEEGERIVIVLDEFQYLGKVDRAFPSVLQKIWDTCLSKRNVMLVLCGSLISMMEEQTLSYGSPLYGRRTAQMRLQQVPFRYYQDFFQKQMDLHQQVLYYSVTGGVPKYIELFQQFDDIYDAVDRNVLDRSSFLYEEPEFLLHNEVKEVGTYFSIIKTIAAGNRKLSQIAAMLEIPSTSLTKPLKTLIDLDIIEREVPVTEDKPETCKQGQYQIKDNFLCFWFRFVLQNRAFIESGHREIALAKIKSGLVPNHTAFVYEDVCRQAVWDMCGAGRFPAAYDRVGRWWSGQQAEIDIVGLDTSSGGDILFGECKFHENAVMGADVLAALREKAKLVRWGRDDRRETFVLFSASGYSPALREIAETHDDVILA